MSHSFRVLVLGILSMNEASETLVDRLTQHDKPGTGAAMAGH